MTSLTLITIANVLTILVTCNSYGTHESSPQIIYVPVCDNLYKHQQGSQLQKNVQYSENYGHNQQVLSPLYNSASTNHLGTAKIHQQINSYGSEQQQTIQHHGSGVSHQLFKQVHPVHDELDLDKSEEHHHKKNVHYIFEYSVNDHKTGDIKQQKEERQGDVVNGEYSLLEEDGNVRTVKYYADWKTGFHAQVHNSKPRP